MQNQKMGPPTNHKKVHSFRVDTCDSHTDSWCVPEDGQMIRVSLWQQETLSGSEHLLTKDQFADFLSEMLNVNATI